MIGIVSTEDDLHAVHVRRHLESDGADYVVLDTGRIPARAALTATQDPSGAWAGSWVEGSDSRDLRALGAVWWRRPQPFRLHDGVTDPHDRGFAIGECAAMLAGLWGCVDAEWVNDPDRDEAASRKMAQLRSAAGIGLRVPRTCMTNDPDRARRFIADEPGTVVFKSFSATDRTWRETRPVREPDLDLLDHVRLAPVIFQEHIPGGVDVRVTIVGDEIFPAEIRAADSAYEFDFRVDTLHAPISPHRLPSPVVSGLMELMRRLGLRYGAVDLRLAPDGDYVFLEVNPAGQWLFVELATGQQISAGLARLLHRLDRAGAERSVAGGMRTT